MPTDASPEPPAAPAAVAPAPWWRSTLARRYVRSFVLVVALPLLAYGLIGLTLTWRQQRDALAQLQAAQADASALAPATAMVMNGSVPMRKVTSP